MPEQVQKSGFEKRNPHLFSKQPPPPRPDPEAALQIQTALTQAAPHLFAQIYGAGKWQSYQYITEICSAIALAAWRGNGRIIVSLPPRHGKSEAISFWTPAWYLHNWPDRNIILTTYEADFAAHWGRRVRNLLATASMGVQLAADSQSASRWETKSGGGMITAGAGGAITGRGGSLLIIDDPHKNWQESQSATIRDRIIDWFNSTLYTRAEPGASIILLQTRWHDNDLAGYLLREQPQTWKYMRYPAISEDDNPQALCPERYNLDALQAIKKAIGSNMFECLYQQRPSAMAGTLIKRSWWRTYSAEPLGILRVIQSWDTAFKTGEDNDYSVCTTWYETPTGYYLVDCFRDKLTYPELRRTAQALYAKYKPHVVLIEDKASGQSIIQDLQLSTTIPLVSVKVDRDKTSRVNTIAATIEAGNVYLPDDAPYTQDIIDECAMFPTGLHDDTVDSISQFLMYVNNAKAGNNDILESIFK